ncbi:MAG: hypothetical protein JRI93_07800 [Deltaproteobacteria bacterium]|nr:hypothetical protein [Deltaproteobacteria bacterium]
MSKMNKLQKWLGIGTIIFVLFYLGAIVITVQSRIKERERVAMLASSRPIEAERHLILPELLLPMGILLTLAASYLIVKRRNAKNYERLDDDVGES